MNLSRLYEILASTTCQLRKQEESVTKERVGNVDVVHVYGMAHESEIDGDSEFEKVDCHFVTIGVHREMAETIKDDLISILKEYPEPDRLARGPSYIEVGGVIGDQGAAFQLFALGEVLGFWQVMTPTMLGFSGPEADKLAGSGAIMISGFKVDG